jgi:hypothetical protein
LTGGVAAADIAVHAGVEVLGKGFGHHTARAGNAVAREVGAQLVQRDEMHAVLDGAVDAQVLLLPPAVVAMAAHGIGHADGGDRVEQAQHAHITLDAEELSVDQHELVQPAGEDARLGGASAEAEDVEVDPADFRHGGVRQHLSLEFGRFASDKAAPQVCVAD